MARRGGSCLFDLDYTTLGYDDATISGTVCGIAVGDHLVIG